jgi:hypothetical protein
MKRIITSIYILLILSCSYGQEDGGMLCGPKVEKPIWVLRFQIIDKETHEPIRYADISIFTIRGNGPQWHSDQNGIAVFVITDPNCLPDKGTLEITSKNYNFFQTEIVRDYFYSNEDDYRMVLEGHEHYQWSDLKQLPSIQEIVNKVNQKKYVTGVGIIDSGYGFTEPNFAPACFDYYVELERISTDNNVLENYPPSQEYKSDSSQINVPASMTPQDHVIYILRKD